MKRYNFVYKTINKVNGKVYVGVHSTNDLDDGYIGCGVYRQSDAELNSRRSRFYGFCHAVCKYGYTNFERRILKMFDCREEAYKYEAVIVTSSFIQSDRTYNIKLGGLVAPNPVGIKRTLEFKKNKSKQIFQYMDKLVDIHSKEYIIVDTKTNTVYDIKNLTQFCRSMSLSVDGLSSVVNGKTQLYLRRWWGCHKQNWLGEVKLKSTGLVFLSPITLQNIDGDKIVVNQLSEAILYTKADKSSLSKLIKGKLKSTSGWYVSPECKK